MKKSDIAKKCFVVALTIAVVFLVGWICDDRYFLGSLTLCFGLVQVTLMLKGSWHAELLALIECVISCFIYWINGLFGTIIFSIIVYIPLGIYNVFSWKKNQTADGVVKINKFTKKMSLFVFFGIVFSSVVFTTLLTFIPGQNYSAFDALSNMLNIAGVILLGFRYKEGWYCWILCNVVECVTWILMIAAGAPNSIMMLIICLVYIVLDVFGIRAFMKMRNNQELRLQ